LGVTPQRGEIWWGEQQADTGRPFLVIARSEAVESMQRVLVAPVTRAVRRTIRSELELGPADGLRFECCASFDNIRPFPKALLVRRLGALAPERLHELCDVLAATTGC
jgi:mRNA-degrading endonuclease toxin of MazEF toxin-antitoxin module